jgi:hypothetical protein
MAIEKKWSAVPPQSITSNGTQYGQLGVSDASSFFVKQIVKLFSDSISVSQYQVKRVSSAQSLELGPVDGSLTDRSNLLAFVTTDHPMISADEQFRPAIPTQDHQRAVYQEEPVVALRVIQVDSLGNPTSATGASGLAPTSFDDVKIVKDSNGNPIQYQFFLASVSVGNIDVSYDAFGASEYKKA